jgi:hypothetical protein
MVLLHGADEPGCYVAKPVVINPWALIAARNGGRKIVSTRRRRVVSGFEIELPVRT